MANWRNSRCRSCRTSTTYSLSRMARTRLNRHIAKLRLLLHIKTPRGCAMPPPTCDAKNWATSTLKYFILERSLPRHYRGGFTTSSRHLEVAIHILQVLISQKEFFGAFKGVTKPIFAFKFLRGRQNSASIALHDKVQRVGKPVRFCTLCATVLLN